MAESCFECGEPAECHWHVVPSATRLSNSVPLCRTCAAESIDFWLHVMPRLTEDLVVQMLGLVVMEHFNNPIDAAGRA
jgi:hypothetical protein